MKKNILLVILLSTISITSSYALNKKYYVDWHFSAPQNFELTKIITGAYGHSNDIEISKDHHSPYLTNPTAYIVEIDHGRFKSKFNPTVTHINSKGVRESLTYSCTATDMNQEKSNPGVSSGKCSVTSLCGQEYPTITRKNGETYRKDGYNHFVVYVDIGTDSTYSSCPRTAPVA